MTVKKVGLTTHDCTIVRNYPPIGRTYFTVEIEKHFTKKQAMNVVLHLTKLKDGIIE